VGETHKNIILKILISLALGYPLVGTLKYR